ncbi:unnamed protein product, partial [Amoebophrya sp. A120]|eukprot:GSA120T00017433001.1
MPSFTAINGTMMAVAAILFLAAAGGVTTCVVMGSTTGTVPVGRRAPILAKGKAAPKGQSSRRRGSFLLPRPAPDQFEHEHPTPGAAGASWSAVVSEPPEHRQMTTSTGTTVGAQDGTVHRPMTTSTEAGAQETDGTRRGSTSSTGAAPQTPAAQTQHDCDLGESSQATLLGEQRNQAFASLNDSARRRRLRQRALQRERRRRRQEQRAELQLSRLAQDSGALAALRDRSSAEVYLPGGASTSTEAVVPEAQRTHDDPGHGLQEEPQRASQAEGLLKEWSELLHHQQGNDSLQELAIGAAVRTVPRFEEQQEVAFGEALRTVQRFEEQRFLAPDYSNYVSGLRDPVAVPDRSSPAASGTGDCRKALQELLHGAEARLQRAEAAGAQLAHDWQNASQELRHVSEACLQQAQRLQRNLLDQELEKIPGREPSPELEAAIQTLGCLRDRIERTGPRSVWEVDMLRGVLQVFLEQEDRAQSRRRVGQVAANSSRRRSLRRVGQLPAEEAASCSTAAAVGLKDQQQREQLLQSVGGHKNTDTATAGFLHQQRQEPRQELLLRPSHSCLFSLPEEDEEVDLDADGIEEDEPSYYRKCVTITFPSDNEDGEFFDEDCLTVPTPAFVRHQVQEQHQPRDQTSSPPSCLPEDLEVSARTMPCTPATIRTPPPQCQEDVLSREAEVGTMMDNVDEAL